MNLKFSFVYGSVEKYFLAEDYLILMKRSIKIGKKAKKEDESVRRSQHEEKPDTESFNSFFGCLKGYDFNEAMNDLRQLRKEEDKRLERLVGLGRSGTKENAVGLKKRIQKGEL